MCMLIALYSVRGSHRRLMSWCSRSAWVLSVAVLMRSVRGALSTGRGSVLPGPRHHAAGPARRHVCARRVQDIRSSGAGAPPGRVRCRAGRVRRTRIQVAIPHGPPRPSLRRSATTHAWRLALGIRCTSVRDRRCVRGLSSCETTGEQSTGVRPLCRTRSLEAPWRTFVDDFDSPDLDTSRVAAALPADVELTRGDACVVPPRGLVPRPGHPARARACGCPRTTTRRCGSPECRAAADRGPWAARTASRRSTRGSWSGRSNPTSQVICRTAGTSRSAAG